MLDDVLDDAFDDAATVSVVLGTAALGTAVFDDAATVAAAADAISSMDTEVGCVDDAEDDVSDDDVSDDDVFEDCCDSSVFSTGTVEFCSADVDAGNDATDPIADVDAGNDATDSVTDVDAGNDVAFAIDDTDASCCAVVAPIAPIAPIAADAASDDGEVFDTADDWCGNGITRSDPGTIRDAAVFDDVCDNREADDGTPGTDSGTVSEAADTAASVS